MTRLDGTVGGQVRPLQPSTNLEVRVISCNHDRGASDAQDLAIRLSVE